MKYICIKTIEYEPTFYTGNIVLFTKGKIYEENDEKKIQSDVEGFVGLISSDILLNQNFFVPLKNYTILNNDILNIL